MSFAAIPISASTGIKLSNNFNLAKTPDAVHLVVCSPDGHEIDFIVDQSSSLEEMFSCYCQRQCLHPSNLEMTYQTWIILGKETPRELGMITQGPYLLRSRLRSA